MRGGTALPLFFVLALTPAHAAETPSSARGPQFTGLFIGDGGFTYNPGAGDYLEHGSTQGLKTPAPRPFPYGAAPASQPPAPGVRQPSVGAGPRQEGAFAPRTPPHDDAAQAAPSRPEIDRSRYSLWDGLAAPLDLPSDRVKDMSPDEASRLGMQDYQSHILAARAPAASGPGPASASSAPAAANPKTDDVFVAVDLDLNNGTQWRDAVADLGRAAGFRQDPRFDPVAQAGGRPVISFRGWMSARMLAQALRVPSVARVEVEHGAANPPPRGGPSADILVGIRVSPQGDAGETFRRVVRELSENSGFRWKRTIGTQSPGALKGLAIVVEGEVPVSELSRVMAHPDVLKIAPAPGPLREPAPRAGAPAAPPVSKLGRFFAYVMRHSPALILLTLLVLLPSLGGWLRRAAAVFVPYR